MNGVLIEEEKEENRKNMAVGKGHDRTKRGKK